MGLFSTFLECMQMSDEYVGETEHIFSVANLPKQKELQWSFAGLHCMDGSSRQFCLATGHQSTFHQAKEGDSQGSTDSNTIDLMDSLRCDKWPTDWPAMFIILACLKSSQDKTTNENGTFNSNCNPTISLFATDIQFPRRSFLWMRSEQTQI